jgi:hypothetical protein
MKRTILTEMKRFLKEGPISTYSKNQMEDWYLTLREIYFNDYHDQGKRININDPEIAEFMEVQNIPSDKMSELIEKVNSYGDLYDAVEMMFHSDGSLPSASELSDIANEYGVTDEEVVGIADSITHNDSMQRKKNMRQDIDEAIEFMLKNDMDMSFENFLQIYENIFEEMPEDMNLAKRRFKEKTTDPNQLSLFN